MHAAGLKPKEIVITKNNKKILGLWDDELSRASLDQPVADGENAPEKEEKQREGVFNFVKRGFGDMFGVALGGRSRDYKEMPLRMDEAAYVFWKDVYYAQLIVALQAGRAKSSLLPSDGRAVYDDLEKTAYEESDIVVVGLLSTAAALALSKDMEDHRDGDRFVSMLAGFCEKLVAAGLIDSFRPLRDFLATGHVQLLADMKAIVRTTKIVRAPERALNKVHDQLDACARKLMRLICVSLNQDLREGELGDHVLKSTLRRCEDQYFGVKPSVLKRRQSIDFSSYSGDIRQKRTLELLRTGSHKHKEDVIRFYELLYKTELLSELVSHVDGMFALTSWAFLLTGMFDPGCLIKLLKAYHDELLQHAHIGADHWLNNRKSSWDHLVHLNALSIPGILNEQLSMYLELESLKNAETTKIVLKHFNVHIKNIKNIQEIYIEQGFDCSGLLKLDVLDKINVALLDAPEQSARVLSHDEKENYFLEDSRVRTPSVIFSEEKTPLVRLQIEPAPVPPAQDALVPVQPEPILDEKELDEKASESKALEERHAAEQWILVEKNALELAKTRLNLPMETKAINGYILSPKSYFKHSATLAFLHYHSSDNNMVSDHDKEVREIKIAFQNIYFDKISWAESLEKIDNHNAGNCPYYVPWSDIIFLDRPLFLICFDFLYEVQRSLWAYEYAISNWSFLTCLVQGDDLFGSMHKSSLENLLKIHQQMSVFFALFVLHHQMWDHKKLDPEMDKIASENKLSSVHLLLTIAQLKLVLEGDKELFNKHQELYKLHEKFLAHIDKFFLDLFEFKYYSSKELLGFESWEEAAVALTYSGSEEEVALKIAIQKKDLKLKEKDIELKEKDIELKEQDIELKKKDKELKEERLRKLDFQNKSQELERRVGVMVNSYGPVANQSGQRPRQGHVGSLYPNNQQARAQPGNQEVKKTSRRNSSNT